MSPELGLSLSSTLVKSGSDTLRSQELGHTTGELRKHPRNGDPEQDRECPMQDGDRDKGVLLETRVGMERRAGTTPTDQGRWWLCWLWGQGQGKGWGQG